MKWNLTNLFTTDEEWLSDLNDFNHSMNRVLDFKGNLHIQDIFYEYFDYIKEASAQIEKIYCYARMKYDLNQKDTKNQTDYSKVVSAYNNFTTNCSFVESELISVGQGRISIFLENKKYESLRHYFKVLFRGQKYVKSVNEEYIISTLSAALNNYSQLYAKLSTADNEPTKFLKGNEEVVVSVANMNGMLQTHKKKENRRKIFESVYRYYETHKNTFASIYQGIVHSRTALAKVRGFDTVLDMVLYADNIDKNIYLNLINTTKSNTKAIKKYYELRKDYFNLDEHNTYDRYLQFKSSKIKFSYDNAKEIVLTATKKIGGEFDEFANKALAEGFVDVYPQNGKSSGAYSMGIKRSSPYILLNHTDDINSAFTVAHEAGHSIHTMFSQKFQPEETADYTLFTAEIASIFNEHLLLDHLLETTNDVNEKIVMLQSAIDGILSTFHRQSLFADFEYQAHTYFEENGSFNSEVLSNIMIELYKEYYDLDLNKQKYKDKVWAYIPHFYSTAFYVYQYATSYAASIMMYKNVKEDNKIDEYLSLLKAGGSDFPVNLVKKANVDLTSKEPFEAVCKRLEELVNELELLLKK